MRLIESRWLVSKGYAYTLFGIIFIHPESPRYLIYHEMVHGLQQTVDGLLWYWRYFTNKDWRLKYEIPAHGAAIEAGEPLHIAASELWSNYGFNIGYDDAVNILLDQQRLLRQTLGFLEGAQTTNPEHAGDDNPQ